MGSDLLPLFVLPLKFIGLEPIDYFLYAPTDSGTGGKYPSELRGQNTLYFILDTIFHFCDSRMIKNAIPKNHCILACLLIPQNCYEIIHN